MNKQLIFAAIACVALAGCSNEEYLGEFNPNNSSGQISFGTNAEWMTRATSATDAAKLNYQFAVFGMKSVDTDNNNSTPDVDSRVFATASTGVTPYYVWFVDDSGNTTTSNSSNWEYVGSAASGDPASPTYGTEGYKVTLATDQTIKYWDYSASAYNFQAWSDLNTSGSEVNISAIDKNTMTITNATAAQLGNLYLADLVTISQSNNSDKTQINKFGGIVQFTFRKAATKVRLGIYETIPGYVVQNVKFRPNGTVTGFTESSNNATLTGSFNGSSPSTTGGTYNVSYDASGVAQFILQTTGTGITNIRSQYFDFGTFTDGSNPTAIGEASTAPTWASGNAEYQYVFPNTDNANNMILYVDYDLYNSKSQETIHVTGAKAVVPAAYMTWKPNYAYTYLFKISDNTNGKTSTAVGTPEGLFPITFDAVTIATLTGEEGTITTVSTPAITTYQVGSVSATGITYANAKGPIYITVNTDGTLADLTVDNTKLYTVAAGTTEADLMLNAPTTLATGENALSVPSSGSNETVQGITFTVGKYAKFTPAASTTYAVEYHSAAVLYADVSEYNTAKGTSLDATAFNALTDAQKTKTPAVYQYKIIIVGANS